MCLGIPGRIEAITDTGELTRAGRVSFGGIQKDVNLAYVPDAKVGDYVIVHVGFAISIVDEDEAKQIFDYLEQMDELSDVRAEDSSARAR